MTSITVTWHTMEDDRVCPICKALNNYTWIFEAGTFKGSLEHPMFGVVSTAEHGSTVQHSYGECRCRVSWEIDWTSTINVLTRIRDNIKASLENPQTEVVEA